MQSLEALAASVLPVPMRQLWKLSGNNRVMFEILLEEHAQNVKVSGRLDEDWTRSHSQYLHWPNTQILPPVIPALLPPPRVNCEENGSTMLRWDSEQRPDFWLELVYNSNTPERCILKGRFVPKDVQLTTFNCNRNQISWRWDSMSVLPFWAEVVITN